MLSMPSHTIGRKTADNHIWPQSAYGQYCIFSQLFFRPMSECLFVVFRKAKVYSTGKELLCAIHFAGFYQFVGAYQPQCLTLFAAQQVLSSIAPRQR